MAHLTNQELEMFASMHGNFPRFLDHLKAKRDLARKKVDSAEKNVLIFRGQGEIAVLDGLIEALEAAGPALVRIRAANGGVVPKS
jgi:hypothetical protein